MGHQPWPAAQERERTAQHSAKAQRDQLAQSAAIAMFEQGDRIGGSRGTPICRCAARGTASRSALPACRRSAVVNVVMGACLVGGESLDER